MEWEIEPIAVKRKHMAKSTLLTTTNYSDDDLSGIFSAFPVSGKLRPNSSQSIDVIFKPTIPSFKVHAELMVATPTLGNVKAVLTGTGAIASLIPSVSEFEFNVIKVFSMKSKRFRITNQGQLATSFFIKVNNSQFQVMPDQGRIGGEETITVEVQFIPNKEGPVSAVLDVTWSNMPVNTKVRIPMRGGGGFPDIDIQTEFVDFGTALLGVDNVQTLRLYNKGDAEAVIVGIPESADVSLEAGKISEVTGDLADYKAMAALGVKFAEAIGSSVGNAIDYAFSKLNSKDHVFDAEDAIHIGKALKYSIHSRCDILLPNYENISNEKVIILSVSEAASIGVLVGSAIDQDIRCTGEAYVNKKLHKKTVIKYVETFGLDMFSSIDPDYVDKNIEKGKVTSKGAEKIGRRILSSYGRSFMERFPPEVLSSSGTKVTQSVGITSKDSEYRNYFGPQNVQNIEVISSIAFGASCLSLLGPSVASTLSKENVTTAVDDVHAYKIGMNFAKTVARKQACELGMAFSYAIGTKICQILDTNVGKLWGEIEFSERIRKILNFGFKSLKIIEKYYNLLVAQPEMLETLCKRIVSEILILLDSKVHDIVDDKARAGIGSSFTEKKSFRDKEVMDLIKLINDNSVAVDISLAFAVSLIGSFGVQSHLLFKEGVSRALAKSDLLGLLDSLDMELDRVYEVELARKVVAGLEGEIAAKLEEETLKGIGTRLAKIINSEPPHMIKVLCDQSLTLENEALASLGTSLMAGLGTKTLAHFEVSADELKEKEGKIAAGKLMAEKMGAKLTSHSISDTDVPGGIVIAPNSYVDIKISYKPSRVEKLDSVLTIKAVETRQTYPVYLTANVGVPKLVLEPHGIMDDLDFGICHVNGKYEKVIYLINEGTVDMDYKFSLMQKCSHRANNAIKVNNVFMNEVTEDAYSLTNAEGVLNIGQTLSTTLTFKPTVHEKEHPVILVCSNGVKDIIGYVNGIGGKAILFVEENSKHVNFGLCRMKNNIENKLKIQNIGNLGFQYDVLHELDNGEWVPAPIRVCKNEIEKDGKDNYFEEEEEISKEDSSLKEENEFLVDKVTGYCEASSETYVTISFNAKSVERVFKKIRLTYSGGIEDVILSGRGGEPLLCMYDKDGNKFPPRTPELVVDLGTKPIKSKSMYMFYLVNEGSFPADYMIQPWAMEEFRISPDSGRVQVGDIVPLKLTFKPLEDVKISSDLKVIWELSTIELTLTGTGGSGKLAIEFSTEEDHEDRSLTFSMVPLNVSVHKTIFIHNKGSVPVNLEASVDMPEFKVAQSAEPCQQKVGFWVGSKVRRKDFIPQYSSKFRVILAENSYVEVAVQFEAQVSTTYLSSIKLQTEFQELTIPISGKGGTFKLSHIGSLQFGDIATNFLYSRSIVLKNEGSITANLKFKWVVSGEAVGESEKYILPVEFPKIDPRSRYASSLIKGSKVPTFTGSKTLNDIECHFSARDYWRMLRYTVLYFQEDALNARAPVKTTAMKGGVGNRSTFSLTSGGFQSSLEDSEKRLMLFYHLIRSTPVGETNFLVAKVEVIPKSKKILEFSCLELEVEVCMTSEQAFAGSLIIETDVPGINPYEIPIQASPRYVSIIVDSSEPLDFGLLNLGDYDVITREFCNMGNKDVNFEIYHENVYLQVSPKSGLLQRGEKIVVTFVYKPLEECVETYPVTFITECTDSMVFPLNAGGGTSKLSLSNYEKFDFGNCMMDKDTVQGFPIYNVGNAVLQITQVVLSQSEFFKKPQKWPKGIIKIKPGSYYNLPILFNPPVENPSAGFLAISANKKVYEISLEGTGRESVLLIAETEISFKDCLVGNTYFDTLDISNVGDVNYPLTFSISRGPNKKEKAFQDCWFDPPKITVKPFSKVQIKVIYKPSVEMRRKRKILVSSSYSEHEIPALFFAGRAPLVIKRSYINFGMFDKNGANKAKLHFRNNGTVPTRFKLYSEKRPTPFKIKPSEGIAEPNVSITVELVYVYSVLGNIDEIIYLNNEDSSPPIAIPVKGHCEESKVKYEQFKEVHLGDCGVMEQSSKTFTVRNYGKFPLEYDLKYAYPIKVNPTSGVIRGEEETVFTVLWNPSGSYELRNVVKFQTASIGVFEIVVKGRAAFPEFTVLNSMLDFGVCAVDFPTTKTITIVNKGKVNANWYIPSIRDGYYVSLVEGCLPPKQTQKVDVVFIPTQIDKYFGNFVVEARGHFKEISLIGIGGLMTLSFRPSPIIFPNLPCSKYIRFPLTLVNEGDASIEYSIEARDSEYISLSTEKPVNDTLYDGQYATVLLKICAKKKTSFMDYFFVRSPQKVWKVYIYAIGVEIDPSVVQLSLQENLPILEISSPLKTDIFYKSYLSHMAKLEGVLEKFVDILSITPEPRIQHMPATVEVISVKRETHLNKPKRQRRYSVAGVSASGNLEKLAKLSQNLRRANSKSNSREFKTSSKNITALLSNVAPRKKQMREKESQTQPSKVQMVQKEAKHSKNDRQGSTQIANASNEDPIYPTMEPTKASSKTSSTEVLEGRSTATPSDETSTRSCSPSEKLFFVRNMLECMMDFLEPKIQELLDQELKVTHEIAAETVHSLIQKCIKNVDGLSPDTSPRDSPELERIRNLAHKFIGDVLFGKVFDRLGLSTPSPSPELKETHAFARDYVNDIIQQCFPNIEYIEEQYSSHELAMKVLDELYSYSESHLFKEPPQPPQEIGDTTTESTEDVVKERESSRVSNLDSEIDASNLINGPQASEFLSSESQLKSSHSRRRRSSLESFLPESQRSLTFEEEQNGTELYIQDSMNLSELQASQLTKSDTMNSIPSLKPTEYVFGFEKDFPVDEGTMKFLSTGTDDYAENWKTFLGRLHTLVKTEGHILSGSIAAFQLYRAHVENLVSSKAKFVSSIRLLTFSHFSMKWV